MPSSKKPAPPSLIDTRPTLAVLEPLIRRDWRGLAKPSTLKILFAAMHALMRSVLRIEATNRHIRLLWNLRNDPRLQAQVKADLGGEPALRRWEDRLARAGHRESETLHRDSVPRHHVEYASQDEVHERDCVHTIKTDRTGQYRLAPVPRQSGACYGISPRHTVKPRIGITESPLLKPAPVRPSDLRAHSTIAAAPQAEIDRPLAVDAQTFRPPFAMPRSRPGSSSRRALLLTQQNDHANTQILGPD